MGVVGEDEPSITYSRPNAIGRAAALPRAAAYLFYDTILSVTLLLTCANLLPLLISLIDNQKLNSLALKALSGSPILANEDFQNLIHSWCSGRLLQSATYENRFS